MDLVPTSRAGFARRAPWLAEDLADLSPAEQQTRIKLRSAWMMGLGTIVVLLFSGACCCVAAAGPLGRSNASADPMVDVLAEVGTRLNIPAFYISFVLAPLASNASEVRGCAPRVPRGVPARCLVPRGHAGDRVVFVRVEEDAEVRHDRVLHARGRRVVRGVVGVAVGVWRVGPPRWGIGGSIVRSGGAGSALAHGVAEHLPTLSRGGARAA